jgi:Putative zinc-finger
MNAIKAKATASCCSSTVMLLADGELEPSRLLEVESHVKSCDGCRAELELVQAMRKSLRQSCARRSSAESRAESRARAELTIRGVAMLRGSDKANPAARNNEPFVAEGRATQVAADARSRRWAAVGAVAVAACFVLVVAVRASAPADSALKAHASDSIASLLGSAANDASNFDSVVDQLVALHANPLPPEERNPEQLNRLEPFVGVPIRRSALSLLKASGADTASFDGARLYAVRESQNAAALQYKVRGHRLTVYVFDSRLIPMARTRLRPRVVRSSDHTTDRPSPIYVGNVRGFSIAAAERSGVGYALASDLDEDKTVQMVASF